MGGKRTLANPWYASAMIDEEHSPGVASEGDRGAAKHVEEEFGVRLDYSRAEDWMRVGDVYEVLLAKLTSDEADHPDTWRRFVTAISLDTGIPSSKVELET